MTVAEPNDIDRWPQTAQLIALAAQDEDEDIADMAAAELARRIPFPIRIASSNGMIAIRPEGRQ